MKAGWKNRIDERRYFEEKKARAKQKPKLNAYEQMLSGKQKQMLNLPPGQYDPYSAQSADPRGSFFSWC